MCLYYANVYTWLEGATSMIPGELVELAVVMTRRVSLIWPDSIIYFLHSYIKDWYMDAPKKDRAVYPNESDVTEIHQKMKRPFTNCSGEAKYPFKKRLRGTMEEELKIKRNCRQKAISAISACLNLWIVVTENNLLWGARLNVTHRVSQFTSLVFPKVPNIPVTYEGEWVYGVRSQPSPGIKPMPAN